ncbi:MAG TPA: hypothetical protein VIM13_03115 [Clostridia bacterium]
MGDCFALRPYCTGCRKWVDEKHECGDGRVIAVTEGTLEIVEALLDLGLKVYKATCYVHPDMEPYRKDTEYALYVCIHLGEHYPPILFHDLPEGWKYHTETSSADRTPVEILAYVQKGCWNSREDIETRIKAVVSEFVRYLREDKDKDGIIAVLTLMWS